MTIHYKNGNRSLCNNAGVFADKTTVWEEVTCKMCLKSRSATSQKKLAESFLTSNHESRPIKRVKTIKETY